MYQSVNKISEKLNVTCISVCKVELATEILLDILPANSTEKGNRFL